MVWRNTHRQPNSFVSELDAFARSLRIRAKYLRRYARPSRARRADMEEGRKNAARALEAAAELLENAMFADFDVVLPKRLRKRDPVDPR